MAEAPRSVTTRWLVETLAATFVTLAVWPFAVRVFALSCRWLQPWQPLAAVFCHPTVVGLALNLAVLAHVGPAVEARLPGRALYHLWAGCGLAGNLLWLAVMLHVDADSPLLCWGAYGANLGLLYAYAALNPGSEVRVAGLVLGPRQVAAAWGALLLWHAVCRDGGGAAQLLHLGALPVAALYVELACNGPLVRALRRALE